MMALLKRVISHLFTAADGETFAAGRVSAALFCVVGLAIPPAMLVYGHEISLQELALYVPALAGAITLLITGTNPTEPKPPNGSADD